MWLFIFRREVPPDADLMRYVTLYATGWRQAEQILKSNPSAAKGGPWHGKRVGNMVKGVEAGYVTYARGDRAVKVVRSVEGIETVIPDPAA